MNWEKIGYIALFALPALFSLCAVVEVMRWLFLAEGPPRPTFPQMKQIPEHRPATGPSFAP